MLKITRLSILLSLVAFTNIAMAATVFSPTTPANGSYVGAATDTCTAADVTSAPYYYGYTKSKIVQHTFTPDKTRSGASTAAAFQAWGNYLHTIVNGTNASVTRIPNPYTSILGSTQDPTMPVGTKLVETAIEWGVHDSKKVKFINTTPFTNQAIEDPGMGTEYFVLTSFTYTGSVNGVKGVVGYGYHGFTLGDSAWDNNNGIGRILFNKPITQLNTTFSFVGTSMETVFVNNINYPVSCISTTQITQ